MAQHIKTISCNTIINKIRWWTTTVRLFTDAADFRKPEPAMDIRKQKNTFKISRKKSSEKLEELLNIRPFMAKEVVLKYKSFSKISSYNIAINYSICNNAGITLEVLRNYPQVLAELDVPLKISILQKMPYDVNITVPLLLITYSTLRGFAVREIEERRIMVLSNLLDITQTELCKHMVERPFLLSYDLHHFENNIKLLTGITKEEIVKDFWVVKYSSSLIEERLLLARKNNIEQLKTWMVRAQPDIFEKYIKRRSDKKSILGNNSLAEYLSERLDCSEEVAKFLINKQPALQNKSLKKMNEMIDFLLKYGFKPIHIRRVPKILLHSAETIKKRLKELEAEGKQLDTLYILTKSQKQYMQYYEAFIKTNKNKVKN